MSDATQFDDKMLDPTWYTTLDYDQAFKLLRDEDPIHWTEDRSYGKNYWAVTRYDDVKEYLLDPSRFSSRMGPRIPRSPKRPTPEERHELGWDVKFTTNDNPIHNLYRKPLNKHFSAVTVGKLRADIEAIVDEIIGEVAHKGEVEFVDEVAAGLPNRVIFRMLGIPREDWEMIGLAVSQWMSAADPKYIIDGDEVKTSLHGQRKVLDYCAELAARRQRDPQDDLVTAIASSEVDGDKLSVHELKAQFSSLIAGGLETTRNTAAAGIWLFLRNPAQRQLFLYDPSTTRTALEEVVRWLSPGRSRLRVAAEDFVWQGRRIKAGDWVVGFIASANKDERFFTDPNAFDVQRTPNDHLGFGDGVHMCLGRSLARLELSIFYRKVLSAFADLELVDKGEPKWIADRTAIGFTELPVRFTPIDYPAGELAKA